MSGSPSYIPSTRDVFARAAHTSYAPAARDLFARSTNPINRPLYNVLPIQVLRPTNYYWGNSGGG